MEADHTLDCRGNACPMPIVKAKLSLEHMETGQVLEIIADDPAARTDFPSYCAAAGEKLIFKEEREGVFYFYIEKKK